MVSRSVLGSWPRVRLHGAPFAIRIAASLVGYFCLSALLHSCTGSLEPVNAASAVAVEDASAVHEPEPAATTIRASGTIQAVRYQLIQTPRIAGRSGRLILSAFIPNGATVAEGDPLVEFNQTEHVEAARQTRAKFDDLHHQVDQKQAENEAEQAKRRLEMREAEAELEEARIELRKGPLLGEIDRLKNEAKAAAAQARVASLKKSDSHWLEAEAAGLRVLELQQERQQVELERAESNLSKLVIRSPLAGMVSHEVMWRNGTMSTAQEGDQLYGGRVLMRIFDPTEMEVRAQFGEPDAALLVQGREAKVLLDAYPDLEFSARLVTASPVASSAVGSPIKTFMARFRLGRADEHLLPDLSAAVIITTESP